jgi:hypothetical protein
VRRLLAQYMFLRISRHIVTRCSGVIENTRLILV